MMSIVLNEYELDFLKDRTIAEPLPYDDPHTLFLVIKYPGFHYFKGGWGAEILIAGFGGYNRGWGAWADVNHERAHEISNWVWNNTPKLTSKTVSG